MNDDGWATDTDRRVTPMAGLCRCLRRLAMTPAKISAVCERFTRSATQPDRNPSMTPPLFLQPSVDEGGIEAFSLRARTH